MDIEEFKQTGRARNSLSPELHKKPGWNLPTYVFCAFLDIMGAITRMPHTLFGILSQIVGNKPQSHFICDISISGYFYIWFGIDTCKKVRYSTRYDKHLAAQFMRKMHQYQRRATLNPTIWSSIGVIIPKLMVFHKFILKSIPIR